MVWGPSSRSLLCSKVFQVLDQLLNVFEGHSIVVARTHTTNAAMALQTLERTLLSTSNELFLLGIVPATDTETDVHAATDGLVRNDLIDLGVFVQGAIDESRLLVGNLLLTANLLGTEGVYEITHHLASNPEVEDGEGVVEGIVFGDGGIVEHNGPRKTSNVQSVQQSRRRRGSLWGQKIFANNDNGDTSDTDVFLGTAL